MVLLVLKLKVSKRKLFARVAEYLGFYMVTLGEWNFIKLAN